MWGLRGGCRIRSPPGALAQGCTAVFVWGTVESCGCRCLFVDIQAIMVLFSACVLKLVCVRACFVFTIVCVGVCAHG